MSSYGNYVEFLMYASFKALPDFYKENIRLQDELQYHSYLLCYMNDIICIHHNADGALQCLL